MRAIWSGLFAAAVLFFGFEANAAQGITQECDGDGPCAAQCSAGATLLDEVSPAKLFSLTKLKSSTGATNTTIVGIRGEDGTATVVLGGTALSCWTDGMTASNVSENPVRQSFIPSSNIECRAETCSVTCYSGGAVLKQVDNALVVQVTNFFPVTGGPINPAEREVVVESQEGGPFRMVGGQEMICALTGF